MGRSADCRWPLWSRCWELTNAFDRWRRSTSHGRRPLRGCRHAAETEQAQRASPKRSPAIASHCDLHLQNEKPVTNLVRRARTPACTRAAVPPRGSRPGAWPTSSTAARPTCAASRRASAAMAAALRRHRRPAPRPPCTAARGCVSPGRRLRSLSAALAGVQLANILQSCTVAALYIVLHYSAGAARPACDQRHSPHCSSSPTIDCWRLTPPPPPPPPPHHHHTSPHLNAVRPTLSPQRPAGDPQFRGGGGRCGR